MVGQYGSAKKTRYAKVFFTGSDAEQPAITNGLEAEKRMNLWRELPQHQEY